MYAQIIELKNKDVITEHADGLINIFIGSLRSNGQILREFQIVKGENGYSLYVTTPKTDSLNERYDSKYVNQYREELDKYFTVTLTPIGKNTKSQEYCSCTNRTAIEMKTNAYDVDSCLICCNCGKPIALYELPYLDGQYDHYRIVGWQNVYKSTDSLWLECLSDRFTGNQLVNVNSALNRQGRKIATEISGKTGAKVYYNIFDEVPDKSIYVEVNGRTVRQCPCCGNPMQYVKFCENYLCVCDDCSLSSDVPNEE